MFTFNACDKEIIQEDVSLLEEIENDYSIDNGRLKFKNIDILQNKIKQLDEEDLDNVFKEFKDLYTKDFLSFRPILNGNDQESIDIYLSKRNSSPFLKNVFHNNNNNLKSLDEDELQEKLEDLIADDQLASLLNENGDILIGDTLYKYTESGLYLVNINEEEHLNKYLEEVNANPKTKRAYRNREIINIDDRIKRFRPYLKRYIEDEYVDYDSNHENKLPNYIVNNLPTQFKTFPITSGRQTFFGGMFGDRRVATAKFSSHRRVKVMYFNQKYLVSSRVGVKVKYQKKGSGFWWRYKADELALGINQAFFEINYKTPSLQDLPKSTIYFDGETYDENFNLIYKGNQSGAPSMPFDDDLSITINLPLYGWNEYTYTAESINTMAWGQAYNQIKGFMNKLRKPMPEKVSVVAVSNSKIYVNHINLSYKKENARYIKRIFNREFQTPNIVVGFNDNGNIRFEKVSGLPDLMDVNTLKLDFYGGAKRGQEWKGFRMIIEK